MTMTTQKFVVIMNSSFGLWKQQLLMTTWQDKVFDIVDEMNLTLITNKLFYSTQYNKEITHMDWTKFLKKKTIKRNPCKFRKESYRRRKPNHKEQN